MLVLVIVAGVAATVVLGAAVVALMQPAIQTVRSAVAKSACQSNLEQIGRALQAYHAEYDYYPPAYVVGSDGKPWHSWRVLLLPYLGDEALSVYQQYNFSQPWDSPENLRLANYMPSVYACPEHPDAHANQETTYLALVGPRTVFPPGSVVSATQIADLPGETIAIVETSQSGVSWLKPQDLDVAKMAFEINSREDTDPGSHHQESGAHVLTISGEVYWLPSDFSPDYLSAMSTINGGELLPANLLPAESKP